MGSVNNGPQMPHATPDRFNDGSIGQRLECGRRDIHVWCVELSAPPGGLQGELELLSKDEQARAREFKFPGDRDRFILGRASLRRILSAYIGTSAREIIFRYGAHGKPFLGDNREVFDRRGNSVAFNVTHSGEIFLCAIANCGAIGIDIEQQRPINDPVGMARAYFSKTELAALRLVDPQAQNRAFLDGWTRKESYIKALGVGISAHLGNFSVTLSPGKEPRLLSCMDAPTHVDEFSIYALIGLPGYIGAIAAKGVNHTISIWQWPPIYDQTEQDRG